MSQLQNSVQTFLNDLASRAPTPGGGSASAMIGATAAALCGMVGRLNDKKDGTPGPLHDSIADSDRLMSELKQSIDNDIAAFEGLASTWKLSDTPANAATKQSAVIRATQSPLKIMEAALAVMTLAVEGIGISKKNCLSDAGVAGLAAHAALEGARLNVMINLPGITNEAIRADLAKKARYLRTEAARFRSEIERGIEANYPED